MNRALRRISIAVLVMFVLLLVNVNYLQGFQTASLAAKPNNARAFEAQFQYQRGDIVTSDNVTVAESVPSGDIYKYKRVYPLAARVRPGDRLRHAVQPERIELYENSVLNGSDSSLAVRNFIDLITGKQRRARTSRSPSTPRRRTRPGTRCRRRPAASRGPWWPSTRRPARSWPWPRYPSYDPNVLTTHDGAKLNAADEALLKDPGNPLLNRAINFTWPPGSTFKIVTSSAYLTKNPASTPQTKVYSPTQLKLPQTTHILTNNDGEVCGDGSGQVPLLSRSRSRVTPRSAAWA